MKLKHTFKTTCHDLEGLFHNVKTLSKFMSNLEKQSKINPLSYTPDSYLSDGFEFFIELLLKSHPIDIRFISSYQPNLEKSNGVDGVDGLGVNIKGEPCAVQIKYSSNTNTCLKGNIDNLTNLTSYAMVRFNIVIDSTNNKNYRHFIFTTAKGLDFYTNDQIFDGKVKCFGYNEIKSLVNNNHGFWTSINEMLFEMNKEPINENLLLI